MAVPYAGVDRRQSRPPEQEAQAAALVLSTEPLPGAARPGDHIRCWPPVIMIAVPLT